MAEKGTAPAFEHTELEADIQRLMQDIKERRGGVPEKEALKAALREEINAEQAKIYTGVPPPASRQNTLQPSPLLPKYVNDSPEEVRLAVEKLIDFAFHNGIRKAAKEAKGQGPFFLDAFHDALTDKLYQEFKERKLFK